jgi:hypothetical protein
MNAAVLDGLMRDRQGTLRRILDGDDLPGLVRTMIFAIGIGGAAFGAAIGSYREGLQILSAAVKLPLVMLFTAALCVPALTALGAALDRARDLRRDLALVLAALALGSVVVAATAPLVLLAISLRVPYHQVTLIVAGCCALAGLAALGFFVRGVRAIDRRRWRPLALGLLMVFVFVGTQMAWTFRPYMVRPRTPQPPFIRLVEGSFFEAVKKSLDSARGIYSTPREEE